MRGTGESSELDFRWTAVPEWFVKSKGEEDDLGDGLDDELGDDVDFDEDELEDDEFDDELEDELDDDLIDLDDEYDITEEEERHTPGPPRRYDE